VRVNVVTDTEFKVEQVNQLWDATDGFSTRTFSNRHGIRVLTYQTGKIGRVSLQTTLINLMAGMALLSGATVAVDFFMQSVMPQKKLYKEYKVITSVDFSSLRDGDINEATLKSSLLDPQIE